MILDDLTKSPSTDPTDLLRLRDSSYATDLFIAAVGHLDFFSWLDKHGPANIERICSSLEIRPRPADVMLTLFRSLGLLTDDNGALSLTQLAKEHLTGSSSWSLVPYISSLKERPVCHDMLNVLKTGKPASWGAKKDEKEWAQAMEREDFAAWFTAGMDSRGAYLAPALARALDLSGYHRLLDIAGGSGIYAAAMAAHNPHLSAGVLERPPVDKVVESCIRKRNMVDRVRVIAGDMFKNEFPGGYDVHLFSNVLHDWGFDAIRKLLAYSFKSLTTGGMIVIHDSHLNADKTGPLAVAEYSVLLMFSTEGKAYSIAEMESLLEEAGFAEIRLTPTVADRSAITALKMR